MAQENSLPPLGYRPEQVSQVTGLGRTKVFELISNGTLESRKIGRSRVVLASSVKALIEGKDAA
ncbi:MAG: helix-turn-helix domain-containing protein [Pseudomonadota bacterium]